MIPLTTLADILLVACSDIAVFEQHIADARTQGYSEIEVIQEIAPVAQSESEMKVLRQKVFYIYNLPAEDVQPRIVNNMNICVANADARLQELARQDRARTQRW